MASTAKGKGAVKTKSWNKHLKPEGKRTAAKDVRRDGKKQIKDAKKEEDEETLKKGKKKEKTIVKEENHLIANFINSILERNYKASHKYLEQIAHHKIVEKMRDNQSDKLF